MPNNIEGRGLTDREMVQLCLELEKGRCRSLSNTLLETAHSGLRSVYKACVENASQNQYELFEMMSNRGWYQTQLASVEEIGKVQEFMINNLHPDDGK